MDFIKYTTQIEDIEDYEDYAEYEIVGKLTDDQLKKIILEKLPIGKMMHILQIIFKRCKYGRK